MSAEDLILMHRISMTVFAVSALGALARLMFVREVSHWFFGVAVAGYVASILAGELIGREAERSLENCFLSRPRETDLESAWAGCRQQVRDRYGVDPL